MEPLHSEPMPFELSERIQQEAAENDAIYGRRPLEALKLSRMHYGHREMLHWAFERLPGLQGCRVLDVGIGEGQSSVLLARAGAQVTGIEVSKIALERADKLARDCAVQIDFRHMPGEELRFEDGSFDAILCISAYHHMDQERAAKEFARVLRPGGRVVLVEPLATNPPAWLYRRGGKLLSREATSEEKPLHVRDLRFLRQHFGKVEWQGMFLFSVGLFGIDRIWNNANPFVSSVTGSAFRWVVPLDSVLTKLPGLRSIAWKIGIAAER